MSFPVATVWRPAWFLFPLLALAACEASSLPRGQNGFGGGAAGAGGGAAAGAGGGQISCLPLGLSPNNIKLEVTGTPDAGTPGENCPTTDTPPSDPAALRVYDLVESNQHARLQQIIGQYVCGTGWIYRGTFAAQDNGGSTGGPDVNGFINSGPVIAAVATNWSTYEYSLSCHEFATGVRVLHVLATAQSKAIHLFQVLGGDGTTYSSLVQNPNYGLSGVTGACDGCVADLRGAAPASLSIGPVTMTGLYCDGTTPLEVTVSGQLTILPTPSAADILEVNASFSDLAPPSFAQQGDAMVAAVNGTLYENVDPVAQTGSATPFHVDWYVNSQDATLFGLRNFRIDSTLPICPWSTSQI